MKYSEAILKGYKSNGGKQCRYELHADSGAMCIQGAANLGANGSTHEWDGPFLHAGECMAAFYEAWGIDPIVANNGDYREQGGEMMPWEHIYGMARAAGL